MKIQHKIEQYLIDSYNIDENQDYELVEIPADILVVSERIDLIAKIKYLDAIERKLETDYFKRLYQSTLEAFSQGSYIEPGKEDKNSFQKYEDTFLKLKEDIQKKGIIKDESLVPVGKNGVILDGAHRTAIAVYYHLPVPTIQLPNIEVSYDSSFFKQRLLDTNYLDYMVLEYTKRKDNVFAICLWPKCTKTQKEIAKKEIYKNVKVIYEKEILLTYNGLKNFMIQIYGNQPWVGTVEDKHDGVYAKLNDCYQNGNTVTLLVVETQNPEQIIKLKSKIRNMLQLENHSIHSTDNALETIRMLELVLNDNSIHFLNDAQLDIYGEIYKQLDLLEKMLEVNNINFDDIVIDSGAVLAIYGIRDSSDLDILISKEYYDSICDKIDAHNRDLYYYPKKLDDLLYNPECYFYYNGFKFLTLDIVKQMKEKRLLEKDIVDINLISKIHKKSMKVGIQRKKLKWKRKYRNLKFHAKSVIKKVLKKIGLLPIMTKVYHKIRGR